MNKIFVYGTLKSPKIQKELFGKELKMYEAILKDYSVYEAEDGWYFIDKKIGNDLYGCVIELMIIVLKYVMLLSTALVCIKEEKFQCS